MFKQVINSENWEQAYDLYASPSWRGLYNPSQFVVRLSSDVHAALAQFPLGITTSNDARFESLCAYSTYFHETIHWWQHVGSTVGLMLSLATPAQAHVNHAMLLDMIEKIGPIKSLRKYHARPVRSHDIELNENLNRVLNNWHDIEFARQIILRPKCIKEIVTDPYFDCVGHSYKILWGNAIGVMSGTVDPSFGTLPNIGRWEEPFSKLRREHSEGHFVGSPIHVPSVGALEIFEGQARFSQIQYLNSASSNSLEWDDFRDLGMLDGLYIKAFEEFLRGISKTWPAKINDPLVGLFLLVCDLSINPLEGFPLDIRFFDTFVADVDPGMRFIALCFVLRVRRTDLQYAISNYSREEYEEVTTALCSELYWPTPHHAALSVAKWRSQTPNFANLLTEDRNFVFSDVDLPLRLLLSRYINFQCDKLQKPEFFVWPGVWSVERPASNSSFEEFEALFRRNEPLFVDVPGGEIRPSLQQGHSEENTQEVFNKFYSWMANYELVRQWIVQDGPFDLDFSWLTASFSQEIMTDWAEYIFEHTYGVRTTDFRVM